MLAAALLQGSATAFLIAAVATSLPSPAVAIAAALLIALGVCWGSNTVAHIHLHTPLFRSRGANRLFSLNLTLLLRIPQTIWRARHLAHHHPAHPRRRPLRNADTAVTVVEIVLLAGLAVASISGHRRRSP